MRRRVYIAGALSRGDLLGNLQAADAAFLALLRAGFAPLCPHWSVYLGSVRRNGVTYLGDVNGCHAMARVDAEGISWETWLEQCLAWVVQADAVLRLPGESRGADVECGAARERGIPVYADVPSLLAGRGQEIRL
jgi:hypothetical protein